MGFAEWIRPDEVHSSTSRFRSATVVATLTMVSLSIDALYPPSSIPGRWGPPGVYQLCETTGTEQMAKRSAAVGFRPPGPRERRAGAVRLDVRGEVPPDLLPGHRHYNDDGNIWWSPVPTEWSELGVGAYSVRRVVVSGVWHAVTVPPSKPWSLCDLIVKRSSDILTDTLMRDAAVDMGTARRAA